MHKVRTRRVANDDGGERYASAMNCKKVLLRKKEERWYASGRDRKG